MAALLPVAKRCLATLRRRFWIAPGVNQPLKLAVGWLAAARGWRLGPLVIDLLERRASLFSCKRVVNCATAGRSCGPHTPLPWKPPRQSSPIQRLSRATATTQLKRYIGV